MQAKKLVTLPVLLAFLALALAGFAGCGGGSDSGSTGSSGSAGAEAESTEGGPIATTGGNAPAPSGDAVRSAKVEISSDAYDPDPVTIEEGGKVIWINRDSAPHTATAEDGSFDTGPIEEGKLKSETFKQPGTYPYSSSTGGQLQGTVEVVPAE